MQLVSFLAKRRNCSTVMCHSLHANIVKIVYLVFIETNSTSKKYVHHPKKINLKFVVVIVDPPFNGKSKVQSL